MRVLIVDDEAPARAKLRRMLGAFDDLLVVGEAANGLQAIEQNGRLTPDAMFIDVQMPEVDGFAVAASLPDDGPALVFVTAYDHYALRAFDTRACDYLLKPVDPARLERAVQRLRDRLGNAAGRSGGDSNTGGNAVGASNPPDVATQLMIADRGQVHVVRCADIVWLESADNYVNVHVGGRTLLMRRTLTALLVDLGPAFVRVHRGAAVAVAAVGSLRAKGKGDAVVVLVDGREVTCSRQYRAELLERLRR